MPKTTFGRILEVKVLTREFAPLFLAYSRSQGRSPEEQEGFDAVAYPGKRLMGFIRWLDEAWDSFTEETDIPRNPATCEVFEAWLEANLDRARTSAA